jgi:hypothetical protein
MSVFTCTAATLKNASFPLGDAIFMAGTVFPKAAAVVIKQIRKAVKKLCDFISCFPKPFYV